MWPKKIDLYTSATTATEKTPTRAAVSFRMGGKEYISPKSFQKLKALYLEQIIHQTLNLN